MELAQENGLLGQGGWPLPGEEDPDLVDISRGTTTFVPGSAVYSSMIGFGMYRGGHVDTSVLGAFQVLQSSHYLFIEGELNRRFCELVYSREESAWNGRCNGLRNKRFQIDSCDDPHA